MSRFRLGVAVIASALVLAGCSGDEETQACGGKRDTTVPRTYVAIWLRPDTSEETIRGFACGLEGNSLVASVYVLPEEPEETRGIEVTPKRAEDAGRLRGYVYGLPDAHLLDDVFIAQVRADHRARPGIRPRTQ
jgi:hypothetical protein